MKKPASDTKRAYDAIKSCKTKFGIYQKTCFHIHTPASYDYKLVDGWNDCEYAKSTDENIYDICLKNKVFPNTFKLDDILLSGELEIFESRKEFLSYLLLANALIENSIDIALVTDHNTIDGIDKLRQAISQIKKFKAGVYPEIIMGIEISCADKNHIVGIFDNGQTTKDNLKKWLEDNLIDPKEGTYRSGLDVLDFINSIDGLGYIAHINSSDMLQKGYLSGAYKTTILSQQKIIGVSSFDAIDTTKTRLTNYIKFEPQFVIDNDSHTIQELNDKCFWIKGSKKDYSVVKEALNDYDISISLNLTSNPCSFIEGIYIQNSNEGFLCGQQDTPFCLRFSSALNCLIGGRGTGKSSVLEIMEYALSQRCSTKEKLDFICAHGNIWILYNYNSEEYLIELRTPIKNKDDILKCFGQNLSDRYGYKYYFYSDDVQAFTLTHYISVYKIVNLDTTWQIEPVSNKKETLKKLFDTRYSVNELVNTAGSASINDFIYDTMFENKTLSNPANVIKVRKKSGLIKMLDNTTTALETRKKEVLSVVKPFNDSQNNILRIMYTQNGEYEEPPLYTWLFGSNKSKKWYNSKNITFKEIEDFLLSLYAKVGLWNFLSITLNKDVKEVKKHENLLAYCTELTPKMVEEGISSLNSDEVDSTINEILSKLITENNIGQVISYIKDYVAGTERFTLEFNINNKEGTKLPVCFKPVSELSLGQKVVAMLSFILGYSEYSKDYRPLIIDQPEDNLDNQYIYKNLVKQLREIKEKRQVIIATHNATIVTNAKADQVCVMKSDNKHGWIETTGYPGEKRIKNHIINYLEGGKESFKHKVSIYNAVLHD